MIAQVISLRPRRRPSSDPLARLLELEQEVVAQLAIGRRAGQRLEELAAERLALEALLLFQSPSGEAEPTTAPGDAKEGA
jgi:hypothetical protein